ncbi:MAG: ATP-binding cassette domain-containing protein [Coriobacteriales bacterium]|jgi:energy-coupling factor transport system ATP-binding protein|nr:ATP-binding cassette domain-containing protein [Coriobacteriales bacterium]
MALAEIKNLSFTYPEAAAPALDDVSLTLSRGEFVVVCGASGCGKTTLLRHLKTALTPAGDRSGSVLLDGHLLCDVSLFEQARSVGFVLQNPDNQIVTDKVWHELAFGLESLGVSQDTIRLRVAEMASFFGIQEWYHRRVTELSGGQKQLLNLAAVMAMQPRLLVLDEPTSQLDPIAASEFLAAVRKVNGELGVTVLLCEHRLEEALSLCDRVLVMAEGRLVADGRPGEVGCRLYAKDDPMLTAMPTPLRTALAVHGAAADVALPISVREGRAWLEGVVPLRIATADSRDDSADTVRSTDGQRDGEALISARDVWFRYTKDGADVLRGMALEVWPGELLAIVGGNGTGKTTALGTLSGSLKPYRGRIRVAGLDPVKTGVEKLTAAGLAVLPQDPQTLFMHNTVIEDLVDALPGNSSRENSSREHRDERLAWAIESCEIAPVVTHHPYDLSGGEQQRVALAMALLMEPRILFMDEPTKGMDAFYKRRFAALLARLREQGLTVVMVSHDVEFCAAYASRCALFFDGGVVTQGEPRRFFSGNAFYTTAANRMSRGLLPDVVSTQELIEALVLVRRSCGDDGRDGGGSNGRGGDL